ncbi:hypothetical protein F3J16_12435 [Burkholderia sp. Ap-962]|uniref:hypothetical protein n=1 Tax=Burkholderia sp. Ap-962 TaxID=2608333 RepID=UPI0014225366|nr:hypothetical protein [Burkholderia sp. Ap-962]NIF70987.1 hypothetical protein [Burkholderia sp. Ap-962]
MSHLNLIHPNPRQLAARVDALRDAEQAAADDAVLAREERDEQIEDSVSFDQYDVTPEAGAVIDAALRAGRLEDVYEVFNTLLLAREATVKRLIAEADRLEASPAAPRFAATSCSQCGAALGPGDGGVSRCADHRTLRLVGPRQ